MTALIAHLPLAAVHGPRISYRGLSPIIDLSAGALLLLLLGLMRSSFVRRQLVPACTLVILAGALGLEIWRLHHPVTLVAGALRQDDLAILLDMLFAVSAMAAVLISWRSVAPREAGQGEFYALLVFSVLGMNIFVSAQNLVTLFLGIELLSIPLYILCASEMRREGSLESGLKYLIVGSVGSATLVYGFALIYGATGSTDFATIAGGAPGGAGTNFLTDPLFLTGLGLALVGFAFKASVAPFHQWTPDVYEGAPTAITAFMATATKAAALGAIIRFFDVAVVGAQNSWAPMLATVAAVTIVVGNVGALGQSSLKRMLGYSGVAQAGYMLSGVVVGTQLGIGATVLYLGVYLAMNLAAFAVIGAREREGGDDSVGGLAGLGARRPLLAWPLTIAMLALAGIPGTVGFIGKFQLIRVLVDGDYTWLAVVLVIGSMISLGYYLRVVAAIWMRPAAAPGVGRGALRPGAMLAPIAGGSPEADAEGLVPPPVQIEEPGPAAGFETTLLALLAAAACIVFGVLPSPLFHLAQHAAHAISGLF